MDKVKQSLNLFSHFKSSFKTSFKVFPKMFLLMILIFLPIELIIKISPYLLTSPFALFLMLLLPSLFRNILFMYVSIGLYDVCGKFLAGEDFSIKNLFKGEIVWSVLKIIGLGIMSVVVFIPVYLTLFASASFSVMAIFKLIADGTAISALSMVGIGFLCCVVFCALLLLVRFMFVFGVGTSFCFISIICKKEGVFASIKYALKLLKGHYKKTVSVMICYAFFTFLWVMIIIMPLVAIAFVAGALKVPQEYVMFFINTFVMGVLVPVLYVVAPLYMIKIFTEFEKLQGFTPSILKSEAAIETVVEADLEGLDGQSE